VIYTYSIAARDEYDFITNCGAGMTVERANGYLLLDSGTIELGPGTAMEIPELVKFRIPETAAPCTIPYRLKILGNGVSIPNAPTVFVTIK